MLGSQGRVWKKKEDLGFLLLLNWVFPSESVNRFQEVHELIQKHGFDRISREYSRGFINFLGKNKSESGEKKNPAKKFSNKRLKPRKIMSKGRDFYRKETETEKETNGFHLSFLFPSRTMKLSGKINEGGDEIFRGKRTREDGKAPESFGYKLSFGS